MVSGKGFWWGKKEHLFERLTVYALFITLTMFAYALNLKSWYLVNLTFIALTITTAIHIIARIAHLIEKYYHGK